MDNNDYGLGFIPGFNPAGSRRREEAQSKHLTHGNSRRRRRGQNQETTTEEVQNLKCGDVFDFRGINYTCLSNVTDERHKQSVLTCIATFDEPLEIVVLQLFRRFEVEVQLEKGSVHLVQILSNTKNELRGCRPLIKVSMK